MKLSTFGEALTAALAPLGFTFRSNYRGWFKEEGRMLVIQQGRHVKLERMTDGRRWAFSSPKRDAVKAAEEVAGLIAETLGAVTPNVEAAP